MDQVKLIIRTYLLTESFKATARRLQVSKNTVKQYIYRAKSYNIDLSKLLSLSDAELLRIIYNSGRKPAKSREEVFNGKVDYWIKELKRVGVTRHLLWEEYRTEHADGYGYSQFCDRLKRTIGQKDLTLSMNHLPGQIMQVDFAGKKMRWVDMSSGEVHDCDILVAVMPHSQYTFAIALTSQKVSDFIHGLNQAFLFFGRLPNAILSDNLKSYVTRADRYDPQFNELCVQLAAHYQLELKATRVAKPKDKASVENMVSTVYTRIYAPLRNEIFHSLKELNEGISGQLTIHNNKPYQKKQGSRQEAFNTIEVPVMRSLPEGLFEIKKITKAKVQRNYHVLLGEERNYYSVPFQYVGRQTTVIYTTNIVEIYIDKQRIAVHNRLQCRNAYRHQTCDSHMPISHIEWKKSRGYNAVYFLSEAQKIGPATHWAIGQILVSRMHESQSYNSCKGIFSLSKKYSTQRLEQAAMRCQKVGKASYGILKRILTHNLDQEDEKPDLFNPPAHKNIRGPKAFQ